MRSATLNHVYRLVWNIANQLWIPVAETSRHHGKSGKSRAVALLGAGMLSLFSGSQALALPSGGVVSSGDGQITQTSSQLTVKQKSQNLAVDWDSFDIASNQTVTFKQPNSNAIALNRVLGNASLILGKLNANGQVFLINPNGILFGQSAQVSVGGLVATTLSLSDSDFTAGNYKFSGTSPASVVNNGKLTATTNGGYIALLAASVSNLNTVVVIGTGGGGSGNGNGHGNGNTGNDNGTGNGGTTTTALPGNVSLAAGQQVTLTLNNGSLVDLIVNQGAINAVVQNSGLIKADGGQILLTAEAANSLATAVVNNTGVIEAKTIANNHGQISLVGDMDYGTTNVGGTLNVSATNGGEGGNIDILANTININSGLNWNSNNTLTLSATNNINLNAPIAVTGAGSLVLSYSPTGDLNFTGGNISFTNVVDGATQGSLTINTQPYTLANSISQLATGITSIPNGFYALANNYDASGDGTYSSTPVSNFSGTFNGLGNAISELTIETNDQYAGLFGQVGLTGKIMNLGLNGGSVTGTRIGTATMDTSGNLVDFVNIGGLIGYNLGTITNVYSTGSVTAMGDFSFIGGLIGFNDIGGSVTNAHTSGSIAGVIPHSTSGGLVGVNRGSITNTHATGSVAGGIYSAGLVGANFGTITNSYATGTVTGTSTGFSFVGGLVSGNIGTIINSYATGAVTGGDYAFVGGLAGLNTNTITNSRAEGEVTGGDYAYVGGLVGFNDSGIITNSFATGVATGGDEASVGSLVGFTTP